jgi:hypothetical protein
VPQRLDPAFDVLARDDPQDAEDDEAGEQRGGQEGQPQL